jgi:hypothetical protein
LSDIIVLHSLNIQKQFASLFADIFTIISQDNKAKIGFEVLAVDRTFYTLQSINKLVSVVNHDFPTKSE